MQTSRGSNKDGQGQQYPPPGQPYMQGGQPGQYPPPSPVPPTPQHHQPQQGGSYPGGQGGPHAPLTPGESHIGNVTIFRTAQFFVHAVTRRTSALRASSGNTTLLEQIRWVSTERQRVLDAQTRLLPQVDIFNAVRREIIIPGWFEAIVVIICVAVAMVVHGLNVFGFPAYGTNEGLVTAHAWAFLHGKLEAFGPYNPKADTPYLYDQTPFGWILLAIWSFISGGFGSFGSAINSGRALMLGLSFGSAILIYLITSRMSGSRSAGLLAVLLCTLSPLGIIYQRQVSLDNIGVFWFLFSLFLIVSGNSRLPNLVFAGITFALAVLSKEIFIVFYPVMFYCVWLHATPFQRKFAMVTFTYISLALMSFFGLYALLNSELLGPSPSFWSGIGLHVQSALSESNFLLTWNEWTQREGLLFVLSAVAALVNVVGGVRNRLQWLAAILLASLWVFIVATGIIFSSYIVILLPLMALNIALAINGPIKEICGRFGFDLARVLIIFVLIGAMTPYRVQSAQVEGLLTQDPTTVQVKALNWLREHAPQDSVIIINSYLYADLHSGSKVYNSACYYQYELFTTDGAKSGRLQNDWKNIDYLVLDDQMMQELRVLGSQMSVFERALHSAEPPQVFSGPGGSVSIYHIVHEKISRTAKNAIRC